MKEYEIRLTAGALSDLKSIHEYVVKNQSPDDADHVFNSILDLIEELQTYPNRGVCPAELRALGRDEYREVFFKPYRIIYSVDGNRVFIRIIADGRRNFRTLLARRLLR